MNPVTFWGFKQPDFSGKAGKSPLPGRLALPAANDRFLKHVNPQPSCGQLQFSSALTKRLGFSADLEAPNVNHPFHIQDHSPLLTRNPIINTSDTSFTPDAVFVPILGKPLRSFPAGEEPIYQMEQAFRCLEKLHTKKMVILYSGDQVDRYIKELRDYVSYKNIPEHQIDPNKIFIINLPKNYKLPGLELKTENFVHPSKKRTNDVHIKRNITLALSKLLNFKQILLLDEDIVLPSFQIEQEKIPSHIGFHHYQAQLAQAFKEPARRVVGSSADGILLQSGKDPILDELRTSDNSLVCMANRILGNPQKSFIGTGAMSIRVADDLPFFPYAYNEDWLFMAPLMAKEPLSIAKISSVLHWNKAAHLIMPSSGGVLQEEFPDIFAESALRAIKLAREYGPGTADMPINFENIMMDRDYWKLMVRFRLQFIQHLRHQFDRYTNPQVDMSSETNPFNRIPIEQREELTQRVDEVLEQAEQLVKQNLDIWPDLLTRYAKTWIADQSIWQDWYTRLPHDRNKTESEQLKSAMTYLNLKARSLAECVKSQEI
jgi:hypothetical protein